MVDEILYEVRAARSGLKFGEKIGKKLCTPTSLFFRASESFSLSCLASANLKAKRQRKGDLSLLPASPTWLLTEPDSWRPSLDSYKNFAFLTLITRRQTFTACQFIPSHEGLATQKTEFMKNQFPPYVRSFMVNS